MTPIPAISVVVISRAQDVSGMGKALSDLSQTQAHTTAPPQLTYGLPQGLHLLRCSAFCSCHRPWACFPTLLGSTPSSSPSCHSSVTFSVDLLEAANPQCGLPTQRLRGTIPEVGTILGVATMNCACSELVADPRMVPCGLPTLYRGRGAEQLDLLPKHDLHRRSMEKANN